MSWHPINPNHAIERVRFVMKFSQAVPGKLSRQMGDQVEKRRKDTRLVGPSPLTTVNFGMQLTPDGKQFFTAPQSENRGWQYVRATVDGLPLEVIALENDTIIYETTDYRRWATFKQRFETVVSPVVDMANLSLDLDVVSLEYFDRFIFDGLPERAIPGDLINGLDGNIHADALSGRKMWHYHRGWFEQADAGDILVNQNIDAVDLVPPGKTEQARSISLLSKAEARAANYAVDDKPLPALLDLLHDVTKKYFIKAVRPELLSSVGI